MSRIIITNEDGNKIITNNVQEDIWFYSSYMVYLGKGTTGSGKTYLLPDNVTFVAPPTIPDGKVAIWDNDTESWGLVPNTCYILDEDGFFIEPTNHPITADPNDKTFIMPNYIFIAPPDTYINPHYSESHGWQDFPRPTSGFYQPVFSGPTTGWAEGLTGNDFNNAVDNETFFLVRQWCVDQGKCEEWYINQAIQNSKDDSNYKAYEAQKAIIISDQAKKKV